MKGCEMCRERGKNWSGDDPKCAFYNHEFIADNWNCATMNELRRLITNRGYKHRDDNAAATIGVLHVGEVERVNIENRETVLDGGFYIVMTWYKERGRVGRAVAMSDDSEPRTLKLEEARTAFAYYNEQLQRERGVGFAI